MVKPTPEIVPGAETATTATELAGLKVSAGLPEGLSPAMNAGIALGATALPLLGVMWLTYKGISTIVTGKSPFAKNESLV